MEAKMIEFEDIEAENKDTKVVEKMDAKNMVCIICPVGCRLKVYKEGDVVKVTGNECKRGEKYATQEYLCPMRIVTSSVRVHGGMRPICAVKTLKQVPKASIPDVLAEIRKIHPIAPVAIGDILIVDVAGTGVAVVATQSIPKKQTSHDK